MPLAGQLQHGAPAGSSPAGRALHLMNREGSGAPEEGGGEAEGGEGALADDARCHVESGEDRRLEQGGIAYEALLLTASSLAAASEGPVRWRRQGEAEPTGV